jgi:hypothetical protein
MQKKFTSYFGSHFAAKGIKKTCLKSGGKRERLRYGKNI